MQYYRQKYDIVIKYKYLPALNAGTEAKPVYLPMEVSYLPISWHFQISLLMFYCCFPVDN